MIRVEARSLSSVLFAAMLALSQAADQKVGSTAKPTLDQFMAKAGYRKVELEVSEFNLLQAPGKANGKKTTFTIDTGCHFVSVDKNDGPKLSAVTNLARPVHTPWGKVSGKPRLGILDRVELNGWVSTNVPAVAHRFGTAELPRPVRTVDVLLGLDFLRRANAIINHRAPCLYVRPSPPSPRTSEVIRLSLTSSGYVAVPLNRAETGQVLVEGEFGDKLANLLLDTGASATLLDRAQAKALGLRRSKTSGLAVDLSGQVQTIGSVQVASLRFGHFAFGQVEFGVTALPAIAAFDQEPKPSGRLPVVGLLGAEFLHRCAAIIDCGADTLYLFPPGR